MEATAAQPPFASEKEKRAGGLDQGSGSRGKIAQGEATSARYRGWGKERWKKEAAQGWVFYVQASMAEVT